MAWSEYNGKELYSYINTAVGLNTNDLVGIVEDMQRVMNQMQQAIVATNENYQPTYFDVNAKNTTVQNNQTTVASMHDQLNIEFEGKQLSTVIKENKSILEAHNFDFSLFPYLENTLDNPTKENLTELVVFYTAVLDNAMKKYPQK